MNAEEIRRYCLVKPGVTEELPFDETTLVFKVSGKMFLLLDLESIPLRINVKCDPGRALELREQYDQVIPGYHMNKKHWNSVIVDDFLAPTDLQGWIDDSYRLVVKGLTRSQQKELHGR
ncbi:MmcQ/YjbR family DNA-binding protein [candidate division KSB1 bacterium]|nr:MmcQ/YjbR family DNA-binding protein [candidate division KSB1 bacterium]